MKLLPPPEGSKLEYVGSERDGKRYYHMYACPCGGEKRIRDDQKLSAMDCGCGAYHIGSKYNRLTVTDKAENYKWKFTCDCGATVTTSLGAVQSGHTKSCGCYNKEVNAFIPGQVSTFRSHGLSKTRTYKIWVGIVTRTTNMNSKGYSLYGGIGIGMSDDWRVFENFLRDMGECASDTDSVERLDNSKGYCKDNCVWASRKVQANNRKSNRLVTYQGKTQNLMQWCEERNMVYHRVLQRLTRLGWSVEDAFNR